MSSNPLDFAPYSDPPASPPTLHHHSSQHSLHGGHPSSSYHDGGVASTSASTSTHYQGGGTEANDFETEALYRTDLECFGAYCFAVFGAAVLLVWETKSDLVRFHAYQSAILSVIIFLFHIFVSLLVSWAWLHSILLVLYLSLFQYLAFKAYSDVRTSSDPMRDRVEVRYVGEWAQKWVVEE